MRLTTKQREVLARMAKPCEIEGWMYGPSSHPFWETRTYRSLIERGLIERDDVVTKTREGWLFTAHLCQLTPVGRAALEDTK